MMRREKFAIANIYVPVKRRATLKPETVQEIAQSTLEIGQQARTASGQETAVPPIRVINSRRLIPAARAQNKTS